MTSSNIILGIWNSNQLQRIKIDNINLQNKVESLRSEAIKKLPNNNFELCYCGIILKDSNTLESYGIQSGETIQVLDKLKSKIQTGGKKLSEVEVQQLVTSFRTFASSTGYRTTLQRLSRKDVLEKIINAVPKIQDDPAALAILQDPDLMIHLSDPETVRKIAEQHPTLIDVCSYIASNLHIIQVQTSDSSNQAGTSTGYSYSLDALSDDDDMDSNSDSNQQQPLSRNSSFNAITAAQLAAAIANATNTTFNTNSAGVPTTPSNNPNVITNEMFSNAIQQAFAAAGSNGSSRSAAGEETVAEVRARLMPQLQQMHEMGLLNDSVNIRALQATAGDVQAAIELVFNGVIE